MTDQLIELMEQQNTILVMIDEKLSQIARDQAQLSPGYRRRLSEYSGFDWRSIGGIVVAHDRGAVEVEWNGHRFDRRKGNRFDNDFIIFSRPNGQEGYFTLIKFADYNGTPLNIEPINAQRTTPDPIVKNGNAAQPGVAPAITNDIRQQFYALAMRLHKTSRISNEKFNELVERGKHEGYAAAMSQAKLLANQPA